mgnify:CR=1 FL=1
MKNVMDEVKRVIFFVGAGASKEFKIKLLPEITEDIEEDLKSNGELLSFFKKLEEKTSKNNKPNLEAILDLLYYVEENDFKNFVELILCEVSPDYDTEKLKSIYSKAQQLIEIIERAICESCSEVKKAAQVEKAGKYWMDFLKMLENSLDGELKPYTVFTTNYDLLFEWAWTRMKKKCIAGFKEEQIDSWKGIMDLSTFKGYYLSPDELYLYKLHGSLNWFYSKTGEVRAKDEPGESYIYLGEELNERVILYPGTYYVNWRRYPFHDLLFVHFRKNLMEAKYLIVVGYSFGDMVIQDILKEAFEKNKTLKMILINPEAEELKREKLNMIDEKRIICVEEYFGKEELIQNFPSKISESLAKRKIKISYFEPLGTKFDEIARNRNWTIVRTETELQNYIKNCNILILFLHEKTGEGLYKGLNEDLQRKIVKYVESGGYLIAFHDALFTRNRILSEELCGHFRRLIKKDEEIEVSVRYKHPITKDISSFKIKDELWEEIIPAERSGEKIEILFSTPQGQPIGWIREYGRGEVFIFALGHHKEIIENKNIQKIIFNAVKYFSRKD